jgi:hypothetical protein
MRVSAQQTVVIVSDDSDGGYMSSVSDIVVGYQYQSNPNYFDDVDPIHEAQIEDLLQKKYAPDSPVVTSCSSNSRSSSPAMASKMQQTTKSQTIL